MSQEMAAIISDSNNAYHARDKAQSEMMALRQQVCLICSLYVYDAAGLSVCDVYDEYCITMYV